MKAEKAKKAERARKKRCLIVIEAPEREEERLTAAAKEKLEEFFRQAPDWWGCNVFRSSGRLGEQKKLEVGTPHAAPGHAATSAPRNQTCQSPHHEVDGGCSRH